MELLKAMRENLYTGKADEVALLVRQALKEGLSPSEILSKGLIAGMDRVGRDFKEGVLFIPEVLVAARAMHAGMDVLRPLLIETEAKPIGRFVIGTVKGDLHDIGKKLVSMMMEGAGFEVVDLGIDTPAERFVEAVREKKPHILGMSALLTTTMKEMETTIRALEESGLRDRVKVMVGGAPVTRDWADSIGADGYAPDAASAVDVAKGLMGEIEK
jgi:5-methyltetrahydrofolate--homocysteine methyltransferase